MIRFVDINVIRVESNQMVFSCPSEDKRRQSINIDHIIRIGCGDGNKAVIWLTDGSIITCNESQATICLNVRGADLPIE